MGLLNPTYQGGVKNYLGDQEMVNAPKYWKSGPDHPDTELAYITETEKDALIKMNLHGSMDNKANQGPSGIISLNGGDPVGGYGPGGSWNGGGGGDYEAEQVGTPYENVYTAPTYPSQPSGGDGGADIDATYVAADAYFERLEFFLQIPDLINLVLLISLDYKVILLNQIFRLPLN